jgi:inorganic phosphate transporter, PiT family
VLSCHAAMALGTLLGGWRIVKTIGSRITPHLKPMGGFSAEMAAATSIGLATLAAVPISTTHAIAGGIAGVGTSHNWRAVRWVWGKRIVYAWILTFPGAALVGAVSYLCIHLLLEPLVRG